MTDAPTSLDPARTAVLVMDFQQGILDRLPDSEPLVARARDLIALARESGAQVGFVRVAFVDSDFDSFPPTSSMGARISAGGRAFHADSPATAIHDSLAPQPQDIVVRKIRVGAFSTTDLHAELTARDVDTLVLAGISTSGVVLSTVRDAADRDYRVIVLRDVCADPEPGVHEFLTERIFPRQGEVTTIGELRFGKS